MFSGLHLSPTVSVLLNVTAGNSDLFMHVVFSPACLPGQGLLPVHFPFPGVRLTQRCSESVVTVYGPMGVLIPRPSVWGAGGMDMSKTWSQLLESSEASVGSRPGMLSVSPG